MFESSSISADETGADVFKTSPQPNLLHLIGVVAFLFVILLDVRHTSIGRPDNLFTWIESSSWRLAGLGCISAALIFDYLWCLARPVMLVTNGSGFILTGGFIWLSEMQPWGDVERFFVTSEASKERVACALKPDAERHFWARRGASNDRAIFAAFFPSDPEQTVAKLNSLRQQALGDALVSNDVSAGGLEHPRICSGQVEPKTIRSTRWLYAMTLAILLSPTALLALAYTKTGHVALEGRTLLYVAIIVPFILGALWLAIRPPALILDANGFTLTGGFTRSPVKTRWSHVRDFFVYNPPKSYLPKIAYDSTLDDESDSGARRRSVEKVFGLFFVFNADKVVNELNDYRQRALGLAS